MKHYMKLQNQLATLFKNFFSNGLFFLLVLPASGAYELHDYGFGAGGVGVADSGTYSLSAVAGEISGAQGIGATYNLGPGLQFTRQSNVPAAPTFSNPDNYYNRLQFILDSGGNPSDTLFAIAISADDFVTTNFIQTDGTIGATVAYQTYADWGGGSGEYVIGLERNTTYKIKVKAVQTKYTETEYSVAATAATTAASLSFDIDVSASDTETGPPYAVSFGPLAIGGVTTATDKVWFDLSTNGDGGGFVYVYTQSAGLTSAEAPYTITSATANLASANEGYGTRVESVTQTSGGPLAAVSPYDGTLENVGILNTTSRNLLNSTAQPITNGRASFVLKAKASTLTPSASDYTSILTAVASATF